MDKQKLTKDFKEKFAGNAFKQPAKVYTGNNIIGIGTMHK
jgi:hypothetical protein